MPAHSVWYVLLGGREVDGKVDFWSPHYLSRCVKIVTVPISEKAHQNPKPMVP